MPADGDFQRIGSVLSEPRLRATFDRLTAGASTAPDVPELQPACDHCHDVGWLRTNHPAGHPLVGQIVECPCGIVPERRRQRIWDQAQIPPLMADFTLDSFVLSPSDRAVVERLRSWRQSGRSLLLIGSVGVGKTGLALSLLLNELRAGHAGRYIVTPSFLARLRATYVRSGESDSELDVLEALISAPLLVADDLGKVSLSEWGQEKLYTVANERHLRGLPTIWTSNLDVDGLAAYLWPATWDRIRGDADVIRLTGESRRGRIA